jgi:predicted unusual protein kinase regulating ubiquinone biosynthesis (AarF/ABC1/UbiB family)
MPPPPTLPGPLRALLEAARTISAPATSARVAVARLEGVVVPDGLPPQVREEVARAIESAFERTATPLPGREVEKALKAAWGEPPGRVLDDFDPEPLAVRPHAQVHRGVRDGAPVAVKVARPGVAAATRSDLSLLDALAKPLAAAFPALDPGPVIAEARERVLDELDLEHEADAHRRVARGLRPVAGVSAPRVHSELCHEGVLVTDFVEGPTLAEARPADPDVVARALIRAYGGAPRSLGLVSANPRANDVVVRDDGEVVLLGLGSVRELDRTRLDAAADALAALRADDAEGFAAALGRLGLGLDAGAAHALHAHARDLLGDLLTGEAMLDAAALADVGERALDRIGELFPLVLRATPEPADMSPGRMVGQLIPLLARLELRADWIALALAAMRDGFDADL